VKSKSLLPSIVIYVPIVVKSKLTGRRVKIKPLQGLGFGWLFYPVVSPPVIRINALRAFFHFQNPGSITSPIA